MKRSLFTVRTLCISILIYTLLLCGCQKKEILPPPVSEGKSTDQLDQEYRSILAETGLYSGGTPPSPAGIESQPYGNVLLATAAHGSTELLTRLLAARNDISLNDRYDGRTLLHAAAAALQATNCNLLLERGMNLNAQDNLGRTPLHLAVAQSQGDVLARLLLSRGATIDLRDEQGMTPLLSAAAASIKLLADKGASLTAQDANGNSALHWAVYRKGHEAAGVLISLGVPLDIQNSAGKSALHHAVEIKDLKMVDQLLKAGANPDSQDMNNLTPRLIAEKDGSKALTGLFTQRRDTDKGTNPQ
jgi:ankyrin repeat protein